MNLLLTISLGSSLIMFLGFVSGRQLVESQACLWCLSKLSYRKIALIHTYSSCLWECSFSSLAISALIIVLNSCFNEQHCYGSILALKMLQETFFSPSIFKHNFIKKLLRICNVSSTAQRFVEDMVFYQYF